MKIKIFLLFFLLIISLNIFCQNKELQISISEKVFGKNFINDSDIIGLEYTFPENIYITSLDTLTGLHSFQLRGLNKKEEFNNKGLLVAYDLNKNKYLWSKKIQYNISYIKQINSKILHKFEGKSTCLDLISGRKLWKVINDIYFVDPINDIGLGYKFKTTTGYSNELEGINLKNGKSIWSIDLNKEYGWNDVLYKNDSTLIIVASGLHSVNIKNGEGWDYFTKTGENNYSGMFAAAAAGVAVGLVTGVFLIPVGHNVVLDIVSNTIMDTSYIYFSSKEQLVKIDIHTGEIIWKYPFPNDLPSKSSIFINDSLIFMINMGYAFMGNNQIIYGKPFIAAFDNQTGEKKYLTLIKNNEEPILNFKVLNNDLYLIFKNKISKYSQETGCLIIEKKFEEEKFGELICNVEKMKYISNPNYEFVNLEQLDSTKVFVYTTKGEILSIDHQLDIIKAIELSDLSICSLDINNYAFFVKDDKTIIVNNEGKVVAEIDVSYNLIVIKNKLYANKDNKFVIIDLKDIIKNE